MTQTLNVGARSLFVTVTAWVFIVLAALGASSAVLQNASIASLAPGLQMAGDQQSLPGLSGLLMSYLPWVLGTGLLMSTATLAAAVGLLLRLDWARRAFIALLVMAIVAHLAGFWVQYELVHSLVDHTLHQAPLPPEAAGVFGGFVTAARVMAVVVTLAGCSLLGWIIRRLMSPAVRQEFA
jgi:hypothetical protein